MTAVMKKQPFEVLDIDIDCTRVCGDDDSIASVVASYTGPDQALSIEAYTVPYSDQTVKVVTYLGTDRKRYKVTGYMVTTKGRLLEFEFTIAVKDT